MKSNDSIEVKRKSRTVAAVVSIAIFALLCAISLPHLETSLTFIPILLVTGLAGGLSWAITRHIARKSVKR